MSKKVANNVRLLSVTFQVFGTYTHGKLKGRTNPKESVLMTYHQRSIRNGLVGRKEDERVYMRDFINHLKVDTDDAFFQIVDHVEEPQEDKAKLIIEKIKSKVLASDMNKVLRGEPVLA